MTATSMSAGKSTMTRGGASKATTRGGPGLLGNKSAIGMETECAGALKAKHFGLKKLDALNELHAHGPEN